MEVPPNFAHQPEDAKNSNGDKEKPQYGAAAQYGAFERATERTQERQPQVVRPPLGEVVDMWTRLELAKEKDDEDDDEDESSITQTGARHVILTGKQPAQKQHTSSPKPEQVTEDLDDADDMSRRPVPPPLSDQQGADLPNEQLTTDQPQPDEAPELYYYNEPVDEESARAKPTAVENQDEAPPLSEAGDEPVAVGQSKPQHQPSMSAWMAAPAPPPAGSGGRRPPGPPTGPPAYGNFNQSSDPEPGVPPYHEWEEQATTSRPETRAAMQSAPPLFEQASAITAATYDGAEYVRGRRHGLLTGLTVAAIAGYFLHRRHKKQAAATEAGFNKQLTTQEKLLGELARDRDVLQTRVDMLTHGGQPEQPGVVPPNQEAAPPIVPWQNEHILAAASAPPPRAPETVPPAFHAEQPHPAVVASAAPESTPPRSPVEQLASPNMVYDPNTGRELPVTVAYGQEFQQEYAHEHRQDPLNGTVPHQRRSGASTAQSAGYQNGHQYSATNPMLSSGQLPADHTLPSGQPGYPDPQHLLPKPKNQLLKNIATPWFWLMLAAILVAFFMAATI